MSNNPPHPLRRHYTVLETDLPPKLSSSDQSTSKTKEPTPLKVPSTDFNEPKPVLRSRPGNIVKMRTVSDPPAVPPELLQSSNVRLDDDEDCPRLASVASVARQRRMSTADEQPHRRRHNPSAGKHSFLLSMTAKNTEDDALPLRRSESECFIRRSSSLATNILPVLASSGDQSSSVSSCMRNHTTSARFDVGLADMTGRRDQMEDSCAICGNFGGNPERNLFLLLDGHSGKEASQLAAVRLPAILQVELEAGKPPAEALCVAFRKTHEALLAEAPHCGTTATAILFIGEQGYVAHVGDSRAAIVAADCSLTRLTEDHRPNNEAEAKAVRARGGFVISLGGSNLRVNGVIAITRSLGDKNLADALSCEPDVAEFTLPEKATLVLACDGLWDVVTDEEVGRSASDLALDCKQVAEDLRDTAYKKGSFDNISVMIIRSVR